MSRAKRDRQLQTFANLWAGWGLSNTTQLDASMVFAHHRVLENPGEGPCPSADDYCTPTTGLSGLKLGVKQRLSQGSVPTAIRLGLSGDPWNRPRRDRWTNIGQGILALDVDGVGETAAAVGATHLSIALELGGTAPLPRRAESTGADTPRWVVAPTARLSLESAIRRDPIRLGLTVFAHQRLWGLPYGPTWVQDWRAAPDRWGVTRWGEVRPELKLSIEPAPGWGIHLAASRPVWVTAGPPNLWSTSIGVHHYRAPKRVPQD